MSDDEFNRLFGEQPKPARAFTQRIGQETRRPGGEQTDGVDSAKGEYRAFGVHNVNTAAESCDVRRWMDGTDIAEGLEFSYRLMLSVRYVGEEELRLFLPDTIVLIEGVKLGPLRQKLARRQASFIQQYSPRIWPRPHQGETVIERIEIIRPEMMRGGN